MDGSASKRAADGVGSTAAPRALAFGACLAVLAGPSACGGEAGSKRPNVFLITVESLRTDHVGCYGYERPTTPALDALAAEGITFENAYSVTSWTLSSHASLFTGLYPDAHGVVRPHDQLSERCVTLAELLAGAGYQTAGVVGGPFLRTSFNLHQGFELYDQAATEATNPAARGANPRMEELFAAAHSDVTNPRLDQGVTDFLRLRRSQDRPFFLFAYVWDPHYDYLPPEPYDRQFRAPDDVPIELRDYETSGVVQAGIPKEQLSYVLSQYDGEIRCTDAMLGRWFDLLKELGAWEDTVVIVTADHGEEFFDHGARGHKNNLHVESVHVPLIVKPAGAGPARRDSRVASLVDVLPTVLELTGVDTRMPVNGRSLLQPEGNEARPIYFSLLSMRYLPDPQTNEVEVERESWQSVRLGNLRLIGSPELSRWQLYDLEADPRELHPLAPEVRAEAAELSGRLSRETLQMQAIASALGRAGPAQLSPQEWARLRALGYVGGESAQRPP